MILSDISIKKPVFAWMLMLALILFGALSFKRMGISQLPDVDFPSVSISLNWEGASPEAMESDVVDIIEDAVLSIQGVQNVSSSVKPGSANVSVEFELSRSIDLALQEIQAKVAQASRNLPKNLDPPVISKSNPDDQPILWLSLSSNNYSKRELMLFVRDELKYQFATVEGVGEVFLSGYVEPSLRVWIKPEALNRNLLTVNDVLSAFQNEHLELPAGQIDTAKQSISLSFKGEATTLQQFAKLRLNQRGGAVNFKPITLDQVADLEEGLAEIKRIARVNGVPSVGLAIRKQRGSNAVAVAQAVKKKLESVKKQLPSAYQLGINFDSTQFIEESVAELNFTLLLSVLLTSIVCWIFLGSWSATINVLLAIPTSIIGSFSVLYFLGFTLNTFTLLGLSLAIGIVVDDAIMVLENIVRRRENGESSMSAAISGTRQIALAALAATVAIIAIFLPVAFMKGVIGRFFFQFGVTMSVAVAFSLLEALTLTPMRCAQFAGEYTRHSRMGKMVEALFQSFRNIYAASLIPVLKHPWWTLFLACFLFVGSLLPLRWLKQEMSPAQDQSRFMLRMQTPVGSSLELTDQRTQEVEKYLASQKNVERFFVSVGGGMGAGSDSNAAMAFITLKKPFERELDQKLQKKPKQSDIMNQFREDLKKIKGIKVKMQDLSMRGFSNSRGFPVEFVLKGQNWEELAEFAQKIMDEMQKQNLFVDIDTDYQLGLPEIEIVPDRQAAAAHGVNIAGIAQTVSALVGGVVVGRYARAGHRNEIRIQVPKEFIKAELLGKIQIRNNRGELIALGKVAQFKNKLGLKQLSRHNRQRAISIFSNLKSEVSQDLAMKKIAEIAAKILPQNYRLEFSGSAQSFNETFSGLLFALILGLLISYMVLASQFNSFMDPFTVLLALPFSISGAFLALLLTQQSLNMYSMIGLILLMGIVKKNSILLVDFTNQIRDQGEENVVLALLKACPMRLRPILMTSTATLAGAIPAALAWGPGAETRIPMAITVIGGLLVSSFFTLWVVPCFYLLMARFENRAVYAHRVKQAFTEAAQKYF